MKRVIFYLIITLLFLSCTTEGEGAIGDNKVDFVDLDRFSGDWYVIALIPTPIEKNILKGIERYEINRDGKIGITYSYRKKKSPDKVKTMTQKGWVVDWDSQSEWMISPFWPLKFPYYVLEVGEDYSYTVIGTDSYDYLWIMGRSKKKEDLPLEGIIDRMELMGYDRDSIIFMEQ
jgi:apolipoprotein D and lipocalin family protein